MAGLQHHRFDPDRRLKYLIILALLAALTYLANRWIIIPQESSAPFFRNHLGDILALPVYLPLSLYLAIRLAVIPKDFNFNIGHIFGAVILFSLIFEGLLPMVDESSSRDPWDIVAYLVGGLLVYLTIRVSTNEAANK